MDPKTRGAWVVHHANKLFSFQNLPTYESIAIAGKAGLLLSGLAASDDALLGEAQVRAIGQAAGINRLELPSLLDHLKRRQLVSSDGKQTQVIGVTTASVLTHTSQIFDELSPSSHENAVLEAAEMVSQRPREKRELTEELGDQLRLSKKEVGETLTEAHNLGFVDAESLEKERVLLFNGNLFKRGNSAKVLAVLQSLVPQEERLVRELETLLVADGCVELPKAKAMLGDAVFEKLHSIGMFDVNKVSNSKEAICYVTRPAAFSKYGDPLAEDAMDLAKAFVTSLTYGMTRSEYSRGRIQLLSHLMRKLNRGAWVGPATAIGEDYKVLELRRVVELRDDGGGMFSMRLLKRDVGELALQVLKFGDASERSLGLPGASVSKFEGPEPSRVQTRKTQDSASRRATSEILHALRTGATK